MCVWGGGAYHSAMLDWTMGVHVHVFSIYAVKTGGGGGVIVQCLAGPWELMYMFCLFML